MGCGGSIGSVESPLLIGPPTDLTDPCSSPTQIPDNEITQLQAEKYWGSDRRSLIICKNRNEALIEFYDNRDSLITGSE